MTFDFDAPLKRIDGESRKANEALMDYWLMGGGRSLDKLAALYTSTTNPLLKEPPTKKINTLKTWSQKLHWQARIARQKEIDDEIALEQYRQRHMSPAEVLALLADIGRSDMADFADVRQPADLKDKLNSHVVKKITVNARRNKDGTITARTVIELHDSLAALEKIGKHHKLFVDRSEVTGKDGGPVEVKRTPADFENLTDDELKQYIALARKLNDPPDE